MSSIRYRIIAFLVISLVVINVVSGYYIYRDTQAEIEEIFNAQQAQLARTIDQLIIDTPISEHNGPTVTFVPNLEERLEDISLGHHYEKKIAYQVWDLEGNLLLMSENAPLHPLSATAPGFSRMEYANVTWHIFALYSNEAKMWIYTAQNVETRDELIELITRDQLVSAFVVNILVFTVVIFGVLIGTRPISKLNREIESRHGNNLAKIDIPISPELEPIKNGINRLLVRISETLEQEKSFSADLSHELRTPLAAIKIHAQNIGLKERLSDEGKIALTRMEKGIENMSKTIEQMLLLNSISATNRNLMTENIGLRDLARDVITLLPIEIHNKNNIELEGGNPYVQGNRALLNALLRNLIENASKYSQEQTKVCIEIDETEQNAIVSVIDFGPGMTDEQKQNSIKRHFRVSDSQVYGSGLGLSIVQKIVELHGATLLFLDPPEGEGLVVNVTFKKVDLH